MEEQLEHNNISGVWRAPSQATVNQTKSVCMIFFFSIFGQLSALLLVHFPLLQPYCLQPL